MSAASVTQILIADDDPAMASMLADGLSDLGYQTTVVSKGEEAATLVRDPAFDVLITDLRMPAVDGLELLGMSKRAVPERPVIVMTAFGAIDTAIESLRKGAYHYLLKPFKVAELDLFLQRALDDRALRRETKSLKRALDERYAIGNVVAKSEGMRTVIDLVERIAEADVPVLVTGETGVGKGLIARVIHMQSRRSRGPFVSVNCAALPENLLESELFGHVKGAFTGATSNREGLFVEADGGTLFLDEIGDMVPALQAKLLDVLERGVIRAVGSSRERGVDVRVISATHRDLRERVATGSFREDLMYRLEGIPIEIPPLRQRRADLPMLVTRLLGEAGASREASLRATRRVGAETERATNPKAITTHLSPEIMERLLAYEWPGNVRELAHVISRLVLLGRTPEGSINDLPPAIRGYKAHSAAPKLNDFGDEIIPVRELQRRYASWALDRVGGKKTLACEKLGVDAKTLNKWLALDDAAPTTSPAPGSSKKDG